MTGFFEHQRLARRNSRVMVLLFALAVVAVVAALDLVLAALYLWANDADMRVPGELVLGGAVATAAVILVVSLVSVARLGEGGVAVARMVGARRVASDTRDPLERRLGFIHDALERLVGRHRPGTLVLEKLYTHHAHVTTAALMAHARGVACLVAQEHGLPLAEYPPTEVKKSLTGNGAASKAQVARMVGYWLGGADPTWSLDATDALALAIVHARIAEQATRLPAELAEALGGGRGAPRRLRVGAAGRRAAR